MGVAENQIGQVIVEIEEIKQNLQKSSQEVYNELLKTLFSKKHSIKILFHIAGYQS